MNVRQYVNAKKEYGYELNWEKAGDSYTTNFKEGSDENFTIEFSIDGFIYGNIHSHPIDGVKIPSFGDLILLRDAYKKGGILPYNKNKLVVLVVVKNPNGTNPATLTYALKIDDFISFDQYITEVLNSYGSIPYDEKIEQILETESIYYSDSTTNLEQLFLNKNSGCGVSLYKANDDLTAWGKLTDNGSASPTNNPCN